MNKRQKRIERLVEHRERQLNERVEQLHSTRRAAESAQARVREEQERLRLATEHKRQLLAGTLHAGDWADAQNWVEDNGQRWSKARGESASAEVKVRVAQGVVLDARSDLKRLEILGSRISAAVRREAEVADQKTTDEHAMRRGGSGRQRGKEEQP